MSFFDTILINTICILFPLLLDLIYLAYKNNNNNIEFSDSVFELVLITTLFLIIKLTGNKYNNYSIVLINIPILFSYIRGKKTFALFLSFLLICYFSIILEYNIWFMLFEYVCYYVLSFISKVKNVRYTIWWFSIMKAFFFSVYMFYVNIDNSFFSVFNNVFISMIAFYICSNLYYLILQKGEEIVDLNNSLKELEKEKTLRHSLFKLTHEIKNPIAVCKGYLDMINLNDYKNSSKYVDIIKSEINRTLTLMDDFLDFTKIKIDKNIMDINYLLEDTTTSMKSLFINNNVVTEIDISDDEVFIDGDYNRLKQVLVNILKNSIEAKRTNDKVKISITTKKEGNLFTISIEDNGVGMDLEELNNLGEAFYTTKSKGTGLGVLLSKEIIELHDGVLSYDSIKNVGTTVNIVLPILEE